MSEFNLENVTEFGAEGPESLKEALGEEESEQTEERKADIKYVQIITRFGFISWSLCSLTLLLPHLCFRITIDYNLYSKFWSLQDYFRNPNQCYNKVLWKTFSLVSLCTTFYFLVTYCYLIHISHTNRCVQNFLCSMLQVSCQHLAVISLMMLLIARRGN